MEIKVLIERFGEIQSSYEDTVYNLKESFQKEKQLWQKMEQLGQGFFLTERGINFLADSLQMVNDIDRLQLFDLKDIRRIYELLVQYYPDNIQYQTDLIAFVYNVLDNEDEAFELIKKSIKLIDEKRNYLEGILNQINKSRKEI